MKNLRYEKKLVKWEIKRLEDRRVRGDFIKMYKNVNKLDEINWERNSMVLLLALSYARSMRSPLFRFL